MAQKEQVYTAKIKQKGNWKFSDVYTMVFDWLKKNGYSVSEGLYKEVADEGKELTIEWEANKKVTDYFKYTITLDWKVIGMKDSEVEVEGKVKKMNKGELGVTIKANFVKDYAGDWEGKPIWKFLRGIFEKHVIPSSVEEYAVDLKKEATELAEDLKAFLRMDN